MGGPFFYSVKHILGVDATHLSYEYYDASVKMYAYNQYVTLATNNLW